MSKRQLNSASDDFAHGYVSKPINANELFAEIARVICGNIVTPVVAVSAEVTICNSLPAPTKLAECRDLIVLPRNPAVRGFTAEDISALSTKADGTQVPTLWLVDRKSDNLAVKPDGHAPVVWPVSLNLFADFIQKL
jgi:hypothetical protein